MSESDYIVCGVDPGLSGALAILNQRGEVLALERMPLMAAPVNPQKEFQTRIGAKVAVAGRIVNPAVLRQLFELWKINLLAIEDITKGGWDRRYGGQNGSNTALASGRHAQAVESTAQVCGVLVERYAPDLWRKRVYTRSRPAQGDILKRIAVEHIEDAYPFLQLPKAKTARQGAAEAVLIGLAALEMHRYQPAPLRTIQYMSMGLAV